MSSVAQYYTPYGPINSYYLLSQTICVKPKFANKHIIYLSTISTFLKIRKIVIILF
jgi:hypothetical protein